MQLAIRKFYPLFVIDSDNIHSLIKLHSVESTYAKTMEKLYLLQVI